MSGDVEHFAPSFCDEHGNTYYPYILKGVVSEDGYSIKVQEPVDFVAKWPSVSTNYMARTDDDRPRRLTHDEVKEFARKRIPCVRDEDRASAGAGGPRR